MANEHRNWWRITARILGELAIPVVLGMTAERALADTLAAPAAVPAAAQQEPARDLMDCLAIAMSQQPNLAAAQASLASAQTQYRAIENLCGPTYLIARDLPIRRKQAALGVSVAQTALDQAEHETAYSVKRTYFSVLYAREQQKVTENVVAQLGFYQERVKKAVEAGLRRDWSDTTVDKITVYLRLAETRKAEADHGLELAAAALREAMGVPPDFCLRLADNGLPDVPAKICRADIIDLALARRPEMAQAAMASQVTCLEIRAQGRSFMPTMRTFAAGSDIHSRPVPPGSFDTDYKPGALAPEMPTTLVGKRPDRMDRARDLYSRSEAVVDKTRNLITLQAEDAYLKWEESSRKLASGRGGSEAGKRLIEKTRKDFLSDEKVKVDDILTNEVIGAQARSAYNEARFNYLISLAALERVTAGGFCVNWSGLAPSSPRP